MLRNTIYYNFIKVVQGRKVKEDKEKGTPTKQPQKY